MRIAIITILAVLSACSTLEQSNETLVKPLTSILKSDSTIAGTMANHINQGELRSAYDVYNSLFELQKKREAIHKKYLELQRHIDTVRVNTENAAEHAIQKNDWKQAVDLYQNQTSLIEINPAFKTSYNNFLSRQKKAIQQLDNSFIIVRAEYLIKELPVSRRAIILDPYNAEKNRQLKSTEKEAKEIANLLLQSGVKAIRKRDIPTARKLIPLAKQLDNNKAVSRASRALDRMTRPLDEHIEKLIEQGTQLYSDEQYALALEKWNEILFLDPNNEKITANRERTEKVLQSLEDLKQKKDTENGH